MYPRTTQKKKERGFVEQDGEISSKIGVITKILDDKTSNKVPKEHKGKQGNGFTSGSLDDSCLGGTKNERYMERMSRHTVMDLSVDMSLDVSDKQLKAMRERKALHDRLNARLKKTRHGRDTDRIFLGEEEIPNYKDEVTVSRRSVHNDINKFNIVGGSGKRQAPIRR